MMRWTPTGIAARLLLTLVLLTSPITAVATEAEGAPIGIKRVAMIGFAVADMDRSVPFYSDVLGFENASPTAMPCTRR